MRAMDVMTTEVISVNAGTTVQALAKLLAERRISGVPVLDPERRLIGIVSEGDLLHRAETGTERRAQPRRRSWWLEDMAAEQELARDYVKSHGRTVNEIMTRDVVSVTETTELADLAMLLETHRIKRVPVLRDGRVVGIVSRANLVRALAATPDRTATSAAGEDPAIRAKLLAELKGKAWAKVFPEDIIVTDRVVHFWLTADQPDETRQAITVAARNIAGVRGVEAHIAPAAPPPSM